MFDQFVHFYHPVHNLNQNKTGDSIHHVKLLEEGDRVLYYHNYNKIVLESVKFFTIRRHHILFFTSDSSVTFSQTINLSVMVEVS